MAPDWERIVNFAKLQLTSTFSKEHYAELFRNSCQLGSKTALQSIYNKKKTHMINLNWLLNYLILIDYLGFYKFILIEWKSYLSFFLSICWLFGFVCLLVMLRCFHIDWLSGERQTCKTTFGSLNRCQLTEECTASLKFRNYKFKRRWTVLDNWSQLIANQKIDRRTGHSFIQRPIRPIIIRRWNWSR